MDVVDSESLLDCGYGSGCGYELMIEVLVLVVDAIVFMVVGVFHYCWLW